MAGVAKQTLKLTLKILYGRILKSLNNAPESSFYRQNTARIVSERLQAVEAEPDISKLEKKIGMGQIEEVIVQSGGEHSVMNDRDRSKCPLTCQVSGCTREQFSIDTDLALHYYEDHGHKYPCQYCYYIMRNPNITPMHITTQHRDFYCLLCPRVFDRKEKVDTHMNNVHVSEMNKLTCTLCEGPVHFANKPMLDLHRKYAHGRQAGQTHCSAASNSTGSRQREVSPARQPTARRVSVSPPLDRSPGPSTEPKVGPTTSSISHPMDDILAKSNLSTIGKGSSAGPGAMGASRKGPDEVMQARSPPQTQQRGWRPNQPRPHKTVPYSRIVPRSGSGHDQDSAPPHHTMASASSPSVCRTEANSSQMMPPPPIPRTPSQGPQMDWNVLFPRPSSPVQPHHRSARPPSPSPSVCSNATQAFDVTEPDPSRENEECRPGNSSPGSQEVRPGSQDSDVVEQAVPPKDVPLITLDDTEEEQSAGMENGWTAVKKAVYGSNSTQAGRPTASPGDSTAAAHASTSDQGTKSQSVSKDQSSDSDRSTQSQKAQFPEVRRPLRISVENKEALLRAVRDSNSMDDASPASMPDTPSTSRTSARALSGDEAQRRKKKGLKRRETSKKRSRSSSKKRKAKRKRIEENASSGSSSSTVAENPAAEPADPERAEHAVRADSHASHAGCARCLRQGLLQMQAQISLIETSFHSQIQMLRKEITTALGQSTKCNCD